MKINEHTDYDAAKAMVATGIGSDERLLNLVMGIADDCDVSPFSVLDEIEDDLNREGYR